MEGLNSRVLMGLFCYPLFVITVCTSQRLPEGLLATVLTTENREQNRERLPSRAPSYILQGRVAVKPSPYYSHLEPSMSPGISKHLNCTS